ncbi:MAG: hypothetical protein ABR881_20355 [Candidatus Sulfotelmatobacter sp.]|jgi:hypothetical protein
MAQITNMPKGITPVWIHDVTHPVGMKWYGYKDDVKLVQYALNKVMAKTPLPDLSAKSTFGPMGPQYPPLPPLEIDGIFGNKSHAALQVFQRSSIHGNACVLSDGQVDPVYKYIAGLTGDPISPRNLTIYTRATGFTMYKLAKDILALYGTMLSDDELPREVQEALNARSH